MRLRRMLALAAVIGFASATSPPLAHADGIHKDLQLGSYNMSGKIIGQHDKDGITSTGDHGTILSDSTTAIGSDSMIKPVTALAKESGSYMRPSLVHSQHNSEYLALNLLTDDQLRQRMSIITNGLSAGARSYPLRS